MNFIALASVDLKDVTNTPVIILSSSTATISISSMTICNTGNIDLRFNMKRVFTRTTPISEIYKIKNHLLKVGETFDPLKFYDICLTLPVIYSDEGITTSSLVIYASGINQKFDCGIDYFILKETEVYH
jgi:hypothetical protein